MSSVNSVTSTYTALSQVQTANQLNVAVAGKQLDAVRQQGDAAVQLIEAAAAAGKSVDTGKRLDVRA